MVTICVDTVGAQVPAAPKSVRVRIIDDSTLEVTVEPSVNDGGDGISHNNLTVWSPLHVLYTDKTPSVNVNAASCTNDFAGQNVYTDAKLFCSSLCSNHATCTSFWVYKASHASTPGRCCMKSSYNDDSLDSQSCGWRGI